MNELISVIVPVFQVDSYLDKCIQSIVNQTYCCLEIILIDDGSEDASPQICDRWAGNDSRIKVIHQKNMGGGAARNAGLRIAKGDYIAFVDSDDYISPNMYECMLSHFSEDIDIIECGYNTFATTDVEFENEMSTHNPTVYTTEAAMREHIKDHFFRQLIWNKLYRRNVVEGIFFPTEKGIDDEFWTYRVLLKARKLIRIPEKLYAYRQHDTSVMHTLNVEKRIRGINAKCLRHEAIVEKFPQLKGISCKSIWFSSMYEGQLILRLLSEDESSYYIEVLKQNLSTVVWDFRTLAEASLSERIWLMLAKLSFSMSCKVRNIMKIGL